MQKQKLIGATLLITGLLTASTFAMTETVMQDKVMATDTMMKDKMMDDKMMMKDEAMMMKEEKKKMLMAITNKSPRSEVAKLQQHLIDEGFLKVRKGTKLGYYGPLTRAAYAKYTEKMKMMMDDKMMMKDEAMMKK